MTQTPDNIGHFTSACIGALFAGSMIVMGWQMVDRLLRRVAQRKP